MKGWLNASLKSTEIRDELQLPAILALALVLLRENPSEEVDDYDNYYYK